MRTGANGLNGFAFASWRTVGGLTENHGQSTTAVRQALIGVLMSEQRPDPEKLTDEIWAFMAGALRLTPGSGIKKTGRDKVA